MEVADGAVAEVRVTPETGEPQTQVKPEVFTKEQVDKVVREARTAVLADAGRIKAEGERALKAAQAAQARLAEIEKAQEEAELEAARDDPAQLTALRERQKRREAELRSKEAESKLAEYERELNEHRQRQAEQHKTEVAQEVGTRLKVDVKALIKLAKFTDGSAEAIEDIAKALPRLSSSSGTYLTPDSNRSEGGSGGTAADVRKDFVSGQITNAQYAEKMKALGVQP